MSKIDTTRSTKINIPDNRDAHIEQETQYGVVWPDGTLTWQQVDRGAGMNAIHISAIVPGAPTPGPDDVRKYSPKYWAELLEARAKAALLDVEEYRDLHHFVKRTVILSVTKTEVV